MKFISFLLLFSLLKLNIANAGEFPYIGLLYGIKETDSIEHKCKSLSDSLIECRFVQTKIKKNTKLSTKNQLREKALESFEQAKQDTKKGKFCEVFPRTYIDILENRMILDEATEVLFKSEQIINKDAFKVGVKDMNELEKNINLKMMKTALKFCENPNLENYISTIKDNNLRASKTCEVSTNIYNQKFKSVRNNQNNIKAWVVLNEPTGSCGIVNLSRFEKVIKTIGDRDFIHWNYIAEKKITNPNEEFAPDMPCSALDEEEYPYTRDFKKHYLDCEAIKFTAI